MKTRLLRIVSGLAVCLLMLGCLSFTAAAETRTQDLFTLETTRNMGISVGYDKEPPAVEFLSPDGEVFGAQAVQEGKMTQSDSGKALFFRIPNAKAGTWQIRYDKKSNTELEIHYAPYAEGLSIRDFSFTKTKDGALSVSFLAAHSTNLRYEYTIYAAVTEDHSVLGKKELARGSAKANETQEIGVSLAKLSSYGSYHLLLEVSGQDNGLEVFDERLAENTFAYSDPNMPAAPENFYLEVNAASGELRIQWDQTEARHNETLVAVYYNDSSEPAYYDTFASGHTATALAFDLESTQKLRVDLLYKNNGRASAIASRTIDMATARKVEIRCDDITNAAQAEVIYDLSGLTGGSFKGILTVNEKEQELAMQGKGSFAIRLEPFENQVSLCWYYDAQTAIKVEKTIYSDRLAPALNIPDAGKTVKTDQPTYILTGTVDAGCTVTVNGNAVATDANGIFTATLELAVGENVFTVVATGPNHNKTQQIVVVERTDTGLIPTSGPLATVMQYIPLAACVLLTMGLGWFVLASRKNYLRRRDQRSKREAVLLLVRDCCIFAAVLFAVATAAFVVLLLTTEDKLNSVEFYELVAGSGIFAGYELLQLKQTYADWIGICAGGLGVMVLLIVWLSLSAKKPKKKKPYVQVYHVDPAETKPQEQTLPQKEASRFCTQCGAENSSTAQFCKSCGKRL